MIASYFTLSQAHFTAQIRSDEENRTIKARDLPAGNLRLGRPILNKNLSAKNAYRYIGFLCKGVSAKMEIQF